MNDNVLLKNFWFTKRKELDEKKSNQKKGLVWNVIIEDNNKIYVRNVFNCSFNFVYFLYKAYKKYKDDYDSFAKELLETALYSYWSKCEYEIIVTSWPPYITIEELNRINKEIEEKNEKYPNSEIYRVMIGHEVGDKIDVFTQLLLNWEQFLQYTWENRKLINKFKEVLKKYGKA